MSIIRWIYVLIYCSDDLLCDLSVTAFLLMGGFFYIKTYLSHNCHLTAANIYIHIYIYVEFDGLVDSKHKESKRGEFNN